MGDLIEHKGTILGKVFAGTTENGEFGFTLVADGIGNLEKLLKLKDSDTIVVGKGEKQYSEFRELLKKHLVAIFPSFGDYIRGKFSPERLKSVNFVYCT